MGTIPLLAQTKSKVGQSCGHPLPVDHRDDRKDVFSTTETYLHFLSSFLHLLFWRLKPISLIVFWNSSMRHFPSAAPVPNSRAISASSFLNPGFIHLHTTVLSHAPVHQGSHCFQSLLGRFIAGHATRKAAFRQSCPSRS